MNSSIPKTLLFSTIFVLTGLFHPSAYAEKDGSFTSKFQNDESSTESTGPAEKEHGEHERGKRQKHDRFTDLSEQDRARLKDIHEKMADIPGFQEAREAVRNAETREAKQEAMLRLREISQKNMSEEDRAFMEGLRSKQEKHAKDGAKDRPKLTDEQKEHFKSIREKSENDPEIKAARNAVRNAEGPEEKKAAVERLKEVQTQKLSPEDREFLEKMKKNRKGLHHKRDKGGDASPSSD